MKISFFDENDHLMYERELAERTDVDFNHLPVGQDDLNKAGKKITFRFSVPILDMHGCWASQKQDYRPCMKLRWGYEMRASQQSDIPYIAFFKMNQDNAVSIALTNVIDDSVFFAQMDQMRCAYACTVTVGIVAETKPFEILVSFSNKRWDLLLETWRNLILPEGKPQFPDAAFEPVYCTWYAAHAALTNEYLDRNAKMAAELGFRTFIVDDGWSYPEMKRVCPEKLREGWYRDIGNWTVSEEKLPDFKKHIEYAQSLGLKYLLWTAPFFAGICSKEYQLANADRENEIIRHDWSDVAFVNPSGKTAANALKLLVNLMKDLNLDGLKLDFLDYVKCDPDDPKGYACRKYFQSLIGALREIKPDALFEFRQNYAIPQMLEFGTQFRAGDVPFDFIDNAHRLANIRITLGDKVPCHADPIYFHPSEKPENVARHMIAALAGVPMLSMELGDLTPEQNSVIRFWLKFYKEHLETFKNGHWNVVHHLDALSHFTVENENEVIAIIVDPAILPEIAAEYENRPFYALNLSGKTLSLANANAYSCEGIPTGNENAPAGGYLVR